MPNTRRSTRRRPTRCVPALLSRLLRLSAPLVLLALLPVAVPGLLAESAEQAQGPPPQQLPQPAAANAPCSVEGMVAAGQARLPGVIVSVTPAAGGAALTTSTGLDGRYHVPIPGPGRYRRQGRTRGVRDRHEGGVGGGALPGAPRHRDDAGLARSGADTGRTASGSRRPGVRQAGRRCACSAPGRRGAGAGSRCAWRRLAASGFRSVPASRRDRRGAGNQQGQTTDLTVTTEDTRALAEGLNLPPGFTPETMTDTVTAFGRTGQTNEMLLFGPGGMGMFGGREGMPGMPGLPGSVSDEGAAGGVTGFSAARPGRAAGLAAAPGGAAATRADLAAAGAGWAAPAEAGVAARVAEADAAAPPRSATGWRWRIGCGRIGLAEVRPIRSADLLWTRRPIR